MALVFVKGFNADSNFGNFLPGIENKGPHRPHQRAAFPNFSGKKCFRNKLMVEDDCILIFNPDFFVLFPTFCFSHPVLSILLYTE